MLRVVWNNSWAWLAYSLVCMAAYVWWGAFPWVIALHAFFAGWWLACGLHDLRERAVGDYLEVAYGSREPWNAP